MVEIAPVPGFGGGVRGGPGGSQVGVGDLVGGAPLLDVGDKLGVESGQVGRPAGRVLWGVFSDLVAELVGESEPVGEVGLPSGVVEEPAGDAGEPGEWPDGASLGGLGGVESPGEDGGGVTGVVEPAKGNGLLEEVGGVVAVGCPEQQG